MASSKKKVAKKKPLTAQGKKAAETRAKNGKIIADWDKRLTDYSVDQLNELKKWLPRVIELRANESDLEEYIAAGDALHKAKLDSQIDFKKLRAAYKKLGIEDKKPSWVG